MGDVADQKIGYGNGSNTGVCPGYYSCLVDRLLGNGERHRLRRERHTIQAALRL
jgi:hypothetical protein